MPNNNNGGGQTPWVTGDVITAERLNGMMVEPLICTFTEVDEGRGTLDKSYNDVKEAILAGRPVYEQYGASEEWAGYNALTNLETGITNGTDNPYYIAYFQSVSFSSTDPDAPLSNMS